MPVSFVPRGTNIFSFLYLKKDGEFLMMQLICLFSPAFLAVATFQKIRKEPIRNRDFACALAIFAGVINMLSTAVLALFFGGAATLLTDATFSAALTFKYLALSFAFALVLPYAYDLFRRTVQIELSIRVNPEALKEALREKVKGREGDEKEE